MPAQFSYSLPLFNTSTKTLPTGAIAGLAGGGVEILWIAIYENLTSGSAADVARGITQSLLPDQISAAAALPIGIAIHMGLAMVLGVAIALVVGAALPRPAPAFIEPVAIIGLLVAVWAINFFVILPVLNPAFTALLPYGASLTSKVLFGVAAALAFKYLASPYHTAQPNQKGD